MHDDSLIAGLTALGQSTRLAMYRLVSAAGGGGMQTGAIAEGVHMPPNYISKHLQILVSAGLLTKHVRGRTATYVVDGGQAARLRSAFSDTLDPPDEDALQVPDR